jgi:hypothetical protein
LAHPAGSALAGPTAAGTRKALARSRAARSEATRSLATGTGRSAGTTRPSRAGATGTARLAEASRTGTARRTRPAETTRSAGLGTACPAEATLATAAVEGARATGRARADACRFAHAALTCATEATGSGRAGAAPCVSARASVLRSPGAGRGEATGASAREATLDGCRQATGAGRGQAARAGRAVAGSRRAGRCGACRLGAGRRDAARHDGGGAGAGRGLRLFQPDASTHRTAGQSHVTTGQLGHEPCRQIALDRQARVDGQPPLEVGPGGGQLVVRHAARGARVFRQAGLQRDARREGEHVCASTGGPGAPTDWRLAGDRVSGDRQQQLGARENPEILLLIAAAQRVAHGRLGLGGRLPFGHGHLLSTEQATCIAYNLQGKSKITMAGLHRKPPRGHRCSRLSASHVRRPADRPVPPPTKPLPKPTQKVTRRMG